MRFFRHKRARLVLVGLGLAVCAALLWRPWGGESRDGDASPGAGSGGAAGGPGAGTDAAKEGGLLFYRMAAERALAPGVDVEVAGMVVERGTGRPVGGVEVLFRNRLGETSTASEPDGSFRIQLTTGTYQVRALGGGYLGPSQTLELGVDPGRRLEVAVVPLAVVRGRVITSGGAGVEGATVRFVPERAADRVYLKTEELPSAVTTAGDGGFTLEVIPGVVKIEAEASGVTAGALVPAAAPGQTVEVVLELPRAASLGGVVRDHRGAPVAGAEVRTLSRLRNQKVGRQKLTATTDEAGRFRFDAITPGVISLEAHAEGHGSSERVTLEVAPGGEAPPVELALGRGELLAGRVTGVKGYPAGGVTVTARGKDSLFPARSTRTDRDGRFRFEGVAAGTFTVSAEAEGHAPARRDDVAVPGDELELELLALGGARGRVTFSGGGPATDFRVEIASARSRAGAAIPQREPSRRVRSPAGEFEIYPLEPGDYRMRIAAPGRAPVEIDIAVPPGGWGEGAAVLAAGAELVGRVQGPGGDPVAGARVDLAGGGPGASAFTGADGSYRLAGVAPGRQAIEVSHPELVSVGRAVEVSEGENRVDVRLAAGADGLQEVEGIGAFLREREGRVQLGKLVQGGPGLRAGLRSRDLVLRVDGADAREMTAVEVARRLRGAPGTRVMVEVERRGQVLRFEVQRGRVRSKTSPRSILACGRVLPESIS